ncbi:MAG: hypothetical protein IPF83_11505 [Rhodanobacteraceae bacterium]|nr:hypothetical protein [Rhodanobacteraceae bacterium]
MNWHIDLPDLAATNTLGVRIAGALRTPLVIGLIGDLGVGKTALVRAFEAGRCFCRGVAP